MARGKPMCLRTIHLHLFLTQSLSCAPRRMFSYRTTPPLTQTPYTSLSIPELLLTCVQISLIFCHIRNLTPLSVFGWPMIRQLMPLELETLRLNFSWMGSCTPEPSRMFSIFHDLASHCYLPLR